MVYGIISHLDDETTRAFFRNKKVSDANVVYSTQLSSLAQVLKTGDAVFVVSVNRFATVSRYGVPHASSGKCWRKVVEKMANM